MEKWQRLVFLLKVETEGTLSGSGNIDSTSSGLQEASQTLGCPSQSAVEVSLETRREIDKVLTLKGEVSNVSEKEGPEQLNQTTGLATALGR